MLEKVVTKSGDELWLQTSDVVGRKEIANARFALWDSLPPELKVKKLQQTVKSAGKKS